MITMSLQLIDKAIQYSKEARIEEENIDNAINEPLFPQAQQSVLYLRIKQNITRGCRKAVKTIPENWKRSVAFSILTQALNDIFHYGKKQSLLDYYNGMLREMIGDY